LGIGRNSKKGVITQGLGKTPFLGRGSSTLKGISHLTQERKLGYRLLKTLGGPSKEGFGEIPKKFSKGVGSKEFFQRRGRFIGTGRNFGVNIKEGFSLP